MKSKTNHYLVLLLTLFFMIMGAADAFATHFRFGQITWKKTGPTTVQFTVTSAWRSSFGVQPTSQVVELGDGTWGQAGPVVATLSDLRGESYNIHTNTFSKTYPGTGPYRASIDSCCRISTLSNGSDTIYRVQTMVDLRGSQTGSTISSITPQLQWPQGPNSVALPFADPDSNNVTCSLAALSGTTDAGYNTHPTAGGNALSVSSDCVVSWDATSAADKSKWALQVELTEGGLTSDLDFIIEVNGQLALNEAPTCTLNGPVNSTVGVGQAFAISATGNDLEDTQLTMTALGVPAGATLVPSSGTTQNDPFNTTFNFTPTTTGSHAVTINFADSQNAQGSCNFSLNVVNAPPVADAGSDQNVDEETNATLDGTNSSDPFGRTLTYSWVQVAGPAVALSGSSSANPSFTAPAVLVDTVATFELTVDNGSFTDTDTVDVTIVNTNTPPVADAGPDQTVEQEGPAGSNVTLDGSASSDADNDPLTYDWSGDATASGVNPIVPLAAGTHNITLTVSDGSETSDDTVQITVADTIAPVITVSDRTVEVTGPTQAVDVSGDATATDAVGVVSLTNDAPATFNANTTTVVTWTACDAAGNCSTAVQNVTVQDTTPPVITVTDRTVEATGPTMSVDISADATATDEFGVASLTNDAPATFPANATTVVTWTATDAAGNTSTAVQNVTVQDTIAPVITTTDRTVEATGPTMSIDISADASATDAVGVVSLTNDAPATFPANATTVVTWTATDAAGNSSTAVQNVTVQDTIAPVVTATDRTVEATGPTMAINISADASATDAVGVVSLTNDAPATFAANSTTVVTWTATDAAGNSSTAVQNVTVQDTIAPALAAPADVTTGATGTLTTVALGSPTATDAVGVVSLTNDAPAAGFPVDSTTTVTWTASDAAGNTSTATQVVTVRPFDLDINIFKTKLKIHRGDSDKDKDKDKDKDNDRGPKDWLQIDGKFTEFSNGDGLNWLTDPVVITLNGFTWNLPPGSFTVKGGDRDKDKDKDRDRGVTYTYKGGHSGLTEVKVDRNGKFKLKVKRTDLSGLSYSTPIPFSVTVGNDFGETDVSFNTRRGNDGDKDKDDDKGKKSKKKSGKRR
ncbi:MAG: HYR domain-containing protein [Candidatus Nitrohelix vancouverensis]|uniref:HYR domain-containing protein n=1 Tax=Candidatus Nitrohelix vancouverensis TaxID=2705534 RepID=A0A7T0C0M4_9BACT|nr:MAG: HYR domain-containing protein [Candidatus Nitrohelix vancouverensis]